MNTTIDDTLSVAEVTPSIDDIYRTMARVQRQEALAAEQAMKRMTMEHWFTRLGLTRFL